MLVTSFQLGYLREDCFQTLPPSEVLGLELQHVVLTVTLNW